MATLYNPHKKKMQVKYYHEEEKKIALLKCKDVFAASLFRNGYIRTSTVRDVNIAFGLLLNI